MCSHHPICPSVSSSYRFHHLWSIKLQSRRYSRSHSCFRQVQWSIVLQRMMWRTSIIHPSITTSSIHQSIITPSPTSTIHPSLHLLPLPSIHYLTTSSYSGYQLLPPDSFTLLDNRAHKVLVSYCNGWHVIPFPEVFSRHSGRVG